MLVGCDVMLGEMSCYLKQFLIHLISSYWNYNEFLAICITFSDLTPGLGYCSMLSLTFCTRENLNEPTGAKVFE